METRARVKARESLVRDTTTPKVRLVRNRTPPMPFDPLIPTLLSLLSTAINQRVQSEYRNSVSNLLDACIVLCTESRAILMEHPSARYILFYERWRRNHHRSADSSFFLEMWPHFVSLDGQFSGSAVSDAAAVRRLDVRAAVADRVSCVQTLELEATNLSVVRQRFYAPDLPHDVPLSVKIFVGRARFMFNAIRQHHGDDEDSFAHCRVCKRPCFFRQPPLEESDEEEVTAPPPLGSVESQRGYWQMCGGCHPKVDCESAQCCSSACERSMQTEIDTAMAISSNDLMIYDAPDNKQGTARVPAALRAALKRNELAARRMRSTGNFRYSVLAPDDVKQYRMLSSKMMNVDLALLHAAAYVAESPSLIAGRVVPPLTPNWRSVPTLYRSAVVSCKQFYEAYRPVDAVPVSSIVIRPRFLSKSRDAATSFF